MNIYPSLSEKITHSIENMSPQKIIIFFLLSIIFFWGMILFRYEKNDSITSLIHSWILLATDWRLGNIELVKQLSAPSGYKDELIWDVYYKRREAESALYSYKKSLEWMPHERVLSKIQILEKELVRTNTGEIPQKTNEAVEWSLMRIKNDTAKRSEYFPSPWENYGTIKPIFETGEKNVIDW